MKQPEKKIYLCRGCPGSGKSFIANKLVGNGQIFSTDDYWYIKDGTYDFDIAKLNTAHKWNRRRVEKAVNVGISPIVIDNTNITLKDAKTYTTAFQNALFHGYKIKIVIPETEWAFDLDELFKRNSHNVPKETIEKMLNKWEDFTVKDIVGDTWIKEVEDRIDDIEEINGFWQVVPRK